LQDLYQVISLEPALENRSYDPNEVWGFLEDGPFETPEEMRESFVFQRQINDAVVHGITDRVMGALILKNDNPTNLTIQMESPMMQPSREGSQHQLESCFLLMDRLFAYGYRHVQVLIDSQDAKKRKMAMRLGFTLESVLYKHMVVKVASCNSNIYSMLNR
jgi:RimJ/RimL family protein N-acetyltransferase